METETAWVKPPEQIGGLDHLSVQAPCINIYARLLPGITNVSDRARYYAFYPWLIWAFDKAGYTVFDDEFVERFRRADVLFTLIAVRQAILAGDRYDEYAGATVGSNTLYDVGKDLKNGEKIQLSDYSLRRGAKSRYFLNKFGGLGQYYLGVLRELEILDGDAKTGFRYTRQIGQLLAESLNSGFDGDLFLSVVESDQVSTEDLEALGPLAPNMVAENPSEQDILTDLFFARGVFFNEEALPRRRTLQSIIELSGLLDKSHMELSLASFRACIYTDTLPNGSQWPIREPLAGNRKRWRTYARNELFSVAVQGLFYVILDSYEEAGIRLDSSEQLVAWFLQTPEAHKALGQYSPDQIFSDLLQEIQIELPELGEWQEKDHEVQLTESIVQLTRQNADRSAENRATILAASFRALMALAARRTAACDPYESMHFEERYWAFYPINLRTFGFHLENTWADLTTRGVLQWILKHWGIDAHLRVGLRKLRAQSKSTFRIRPSDRGLEVISVPSAVHTSPRFSQAVRILKDLGALERTSSDRWRPSALGQQIVALDDAP